MISQPVSCNSFIWKNFARRDVFCILQQTQFLQNLLGCPEEQWRISNCLGLGIFFKTEFTLKTSGNNVTGMLHSNLIEQKFRDSSPHFTQPSSPKSMVLWSSPVSDFCRSTWVIRFMPLLKAYLVPVLPSECSFIFPCHHALEMFCLRFYPHVRLYCASFIPVTYKLPCNRVTSSGGYNDGTHRRFSASVPAGCGPSEGHGEGQRMWMLMCCRVLLMFFCLGVRSHAITVRTWFLCSLPHLTLLKSTPCFSFVLCWWVVLSSVSSISTSLKLW